MTTWDDATATWDDAGAAWDGGGGAPAPGAFHVVPDAERVLVDFLLGQPELAALVDDRVYSVLPTAPAWPALRVTRWGGWAAMSRPLWLDEAWCQVDTWADRKVEASEVARLARSLIAYRITASRGDVVSAARMGFLQDAPDQSYTPARAHFRFDVGLMVHPPHAAAAPRRQPA